MLKPNTLNPPHSRSLPQLSGLVEERLPREWNILGSWSSGIMECTCISFTFKNGVPVMRLGRQLCGIIHYY